MKKRKKLFQRLVAGTMAILTAFSVIPTSTVFAASEKATITFEYAYDSKGNAIHFQQTVTHGGITCGHAGETRVRIYADEDDAYCIQPGISLHTGDKLSKDASATWNALSANQKSVVNLALLYGAQGNRANLSGVTDEKVLATQLIIWEIVSECRNATAPYKRTNAKFFNSHCINGANSGVAKAYKEIEGFMEQHNTIPSFASGKNDSAAKELKWDGEKYVLKLTDSNEILSKFQFTSSNSSVKVSRSGNTLTITSDKAITEEVLLTATKKIPTVKSSAKLIAYGDPKLQDVVTGVENTAEVKAYLNVKIPYGHAKIVKTSEDGVVEGIKFNIKGNGIDKTVTSGKDGSIKIENLQPGTYTVTEVVADRYEPQQSQNVKVTGGETATVKFSNVLKRGDLKVTKSSEDGLVEEIKFRLYGTSLSGASVDEYATTDKYGVATFKDVLISGKTPYVLEEVETAEKYVVPEKQETVINWNEVTNKTVTNILKKFRVEVTKTDAEKGTAQGNGTLAGAVYGIYDGDTLVDTYTTDEDGKFTTNDYICGDDWSIREITPSEGYLLDETAHHVGAEAKNYTVERNTISNSVTEQVVKGKISIIKHTDDGSTQIETPEEGAEFQVYLKSSGSYENAAETERDILICDKYGYAKTKSLPYGTYTVHQTKGWEGRELINDFDVFVSKNGEVYRYLINNRLFESYIKVVKKDAETGKVIQMEGAGFEIYDASGNKVTMKYTYPEVTTIDTFYTGRDGYLITPEVLAYGNYQLVEVQAPQGYVLDRTPIAFTVNADSSTDEAGVAVVVVEKNDMPQKGKIQIEKTGEEFVSVNESGEENKMYAPVYDVKEKAGAEYEIIAVEDIITGDGTVRAKAGEVVDVITTDETGLATSKELYLGKYKVVEKKAPNGLVLNTEEHEVELVYAGQEISVTEVQDSYYNNRQKVKIDLKKSMEQNELFELGSNGEIQNVSFGLYAAEDIAAFDDSKIPADGLIETVSCDTEGNVEFTSDLPFGKYYVKEVATDEHYLISEAKYPVEFAYQGQDVEVVLIHVNEGTAIENELTKGKISGLKVDAEDKVLSGAKIGLFRTDAEEFTEETAIMVTISDENGAFAFDEVPYGSYIIREMESPKGYVLNKALHYVSITEDNEIVEVKIINKQIIGSVRLTKVDADYPDNKLTGATFALYQDTDGNKEFDVEKDTLICEIEEITEGIYQKDELVYGGYFVKETKAPEGFKLDEAVYYFEIIEDGAIIEVENKAGVGFINEPIRGKLELTKKDVSDGKLLPNAGFRIKDEAGNIVATGKTDQNGLATFTLRYGKYTYQEYDAPEGYQIDEKEYPFEIKEDGQIVKATMTNEKKPVEVITTPKTGDESNVGMWLGLAGLSAVGIAVFGTLWKRKDKKEVHNGSDE